MPITGTADRCSGGHHKIFQHCSGKYCILSPLPNQEIPQDMPEEHVKTAQMIKNLVTKYRVAADKFLENQKAGKDESTNQEIFMGEVLEALGYEQSNVMLLTMNPSEKKVIWSLIHCAFETNSLN